MNTTQNIPASPNKTSLWPYAIIMVFVLFALYIGYMVKQAMSTSVDLVSTDYYQKELNYQQQMNSMSQTAKLETAVAISHDKNTHQLTIALPAEFSGKQISGSLHFFRPSDLNLDFTVPLQVNDQLQQYLSTERMATGLWRLRLNYTVNEQAYFTEQEITIAK